MSPSIAVCWAGLGSGHDPVAAAVSSQGDRSTSSVTRRMKPLAMRPRTPEAPARTVASADVSFEPDCSRRSSSEACRGARCRRAANSASAAAWSTARLSKDREAGRINGRHSRYSTFARFCLTSMRMSRSTSSFGHRCLRDESSIRRCACREASICCWMGPSLPASWARRSPLNACGNRSGDSMSSTVRAVLRSIPGGRAARITSPHDVR